MGKVVVAHEKMVKDLPNAVYNEKLERETGADILVSIASTPCIPPMWRKQLEARHAKLIQVKHGHDFTNSIDDGRLHRQIEAMQRYALHPSQRVLLIVGDVAFTNGKMYIDGIEGKSSREVNGVLTAWHERGGVWEVCGESELAYTVEQHAKHLENIRDTPVKLILEKQAYPADPPLDPEIDPLQLIRAVTDFRRMLIGAPNTGIETVEYLWKVTDGNPIQCLQIMTHPTDWKLLTNKPRSIGKAWVENNRRFFGLKDGQTIDAFIANAPEQPDDLPF